MARRTAARNTVMVRRATSTQMAAAAAAAAAAKTKASEADDLLDGLSIADLTLDTPLKPFVPKRRVPATPFHFLSLPSEIRIQIYEYFFDDEEAETREVLDLEPSNYRRFHRKLGLNRVCRQVRSEVTFYFYSTRSFRIFPTFPGRYFKTKKPLLARLKPKQRACITSLQLRLGPGWGAPPRGWVVNDALGLDECTNVKILRVYVEIDPSDKSINGFRRADGFYEGFCCNLLTEILDRMPGVIAIEFDGYPGVKKSGSMMQSLIGVVNAKERAIEWGPSRGWTATEDADPVPEKNPFKAANWSTEHRLDAES